MLCCSELMTHGCWGCRNLYQEFLNMIHNLRTLCLNAAWIYCALSRYEDFLQGHLQVLALSELVLVLVSVLCNFRRKPKLSEEPVYSVAFENCVSVDLTFLKLQLFSHLICYSFTECTFPLVRCECTNTLLAQTLSRFVTVLSLLQVQSFC